MTDKELNLAYDRVCNSLAERRLKPAFDMLRALITGNGLGVYLDECRDLEDTYHNMLRYTLEGVSDPERQNVYHKLIVSVFELADDVHEALRMKYSSTLEYRRKRVPSGWKVADPLKFVKELDELFLQDIKVSGVTGKTGKSQKQQASPEGKKAMTDILRLFYHTWMIDKISNDEALGLERFFKSTLVPIAYKSFMIAALMLSLRRFFDPAKFSLLFDQYGPSEPETAQRALTGLLVNLYKYDYRLEYYPAIRSRLKILDENPAFRQNVETIVTQFIRSKGTEKLQKKIREDILPDMIKISANLKDKINLDSLMEEGFADDRNPDWEDMFRDSPGFLKKMEEFSEMQMKGDDVFMASFSSLKSFPFFQEPANWFMPFFPANPEIEEIMQENELPIWQLVQVVEQAPLLCNSDKYSFCLSIRNLPRENLAMLTQAMDAEMNQFREMLAEDDLLSTGKKPEFISNQFIQDLYRFYKLYPGKADFEDIFEWRLDFHNRKALSELFGQDRKMLRNIGEYYFVSGYFEEAAGIFTSLLEQEKTEELYQKIAWCCQKTGDYNTALDHYLKAELLGNNNVWTLKKIALCYRNLRKPDKALDYYRAAEKADPESLNLQLNIGNCLLELDRYEEALKCYFKIEYLAPGNKKVWRPLGWCSFITGNKEQAEKYFLKLMDEEPGRHDFISMGHVQWSLGRRKSALDYYLRSMSENGFTEAEFLEIFEEDRPDLLGQGIDKDDIPIMLDQLRYYLKG